MSQQLTNEKKAAVEGLASVAKLGVGLAIVSISLGSLSIAIHINQWFGASVLDRSALLTIIGGFGAIAFWAGSEHLRRLTAERRSEALASRLAIAEGRGELDRLSNFAAPPT